MKLVFAILFILFGSFLIGLTINSIGDIGNIIMNIIGFGCFLAAFLYCKKQQER
ncbi:serine kinase [Bacillus taeanensis]|uniref:Serine kinase n=1 Tax=Bacillus taeanensis TaxID=273032 RepID=A0A366XWT1_9BACI|nr:serine kinase [Bacillus taeanensis]